MLAKLLVPKVAGTIGGILLALLLATGVFAYVQTQRIAGEVSKREAAELLLASARAELKGFEVALAFRDQLIADQNEAVAELTKAREEDRKAYLARIAAADQRAKINEERAKELLARPVPEGDELKQCRAARELLVEEMTR